MAADCLDQVAALAAEHLDTSQGTMANGQMGLTKMLPPQKSPRILYLGSKLILLSLGFCILVAASSPPAETRMDS